MAKVPGSLIDAQTISDPRARRIQELAQSPGNTAPQQPDVQDQKAWLASWLAHPETQKRMQTNLAANATGVAPASITQDAAGQYENQARATLAQALNNVNGTTIVDARPLAGQPQDKSFLSDLRGAFYAGNGTFARSVPEARAVGIFQNPTTGTSPGMAAHEITHASGLDDFMNAMSFVPRPDAKMVKREYRKSGPEWKAYLESESEMYPELMDTRYSMKLQPGQQVTPEMLNTFTKQSKGTPNNLFRKYKPEQILYLLNTLAQSGQGSDLQNLA